MENKPAVGYLIRLTPKERPTVVLYFNTWVKRVLGFLRKKKGLLFFFLLNSLGDWAQEGIE